MLSAHPWEVPPSCATLTLLCQVLLSLVDAKDQCIEELWTMLQECLTDMHE